MKDSISDNGSKIDSVVATLDSHHKMHIANPSFWIDSETGKKHPTPFTFISSDDIKQKKWIPRRDLGTELKKYIDPSIFTSSAQNGDNFDIEKYCVEYATKLEEGGRFKIIIWPEHCLIGSPGHCIVPDVLDAMDCWIEATGKTVHFVHKGQNLLTEMYSALKAEVPIDASTSFSYDLMNELLQSERLLVCGQALSHCVNFTVRDIVDHWPAERRSDIVLLVDCASTIAGFEETTSNFITDMEAAGVTVCASSNVWKNV